MSAALRALDAEIVIVAARLEKLRGARDALVAIEAANAAVASPYKEPARARRSLPSCAHCGTTEATRFSPSQPYVCRACRKKDKPRARMLAERAGLRRGTGLVRCTSPRMPTSETAALAQIDMCGWLGLSSQRAEHLQLVHDLAQPTDKQLAAFEPVVPVPDDEDD